MKRPVTITLAAGFLVSLLAACGGGSEAGEHTVRAGTYSANITELPRIVAESEGYFENEGIDVDFISFKSAPDAIAATRSGDLDIAFVGGLNPGVSWGSANFRA